MENDNQKRDLCFDGLENDHLLHQLICGSNKSLNGNLENKTEENKTQENKMD